MADKNTVKANKTITQHYVPQFYLKKFCNSNSKLYVYDKEKQNYFKATPKDICFEKNLYEYEANNSLLGGGKPILPNDIENIYADEEGKYSALLDTIINRMDEQINPNALILNSDEVDLLCSFVNNLLVRNPLSIKLVLTDDYYENSTNTLKKSGKDEVINDIFKLLGLGNPESLKKAIFKKIYLDTDKSKSKAFTLKPYIKEMSFVFLKSESESFITSSFPVRKAIMKDNQDYFDSLYFPLSPKYAINFFHDKTSDRNRIRTIDNEMTKKLNIWMAMDLDNRFLISNKKENISIIIK